MEIEASTKASHVIVSPSLVWSGTVDTSRPMSEEFNRVYMHLFDDHSHGNNNTSQNASTFIDDDDSAMDELLLMASQEYEYKETIRVTEGVKKSAVPEEHQNRASMPYPYMPMPSSSYLSVSSEVTGDTVPKRVIHHSNLQISALPSTIIREVQSTLS